MNAGFYGKIRVMSAPSSAPVPTLAEAAQWAPERIVELAQANVALQRDIDAMRLEFAALKHQLEWFRRQLFGQKSEKRVVPPDPAQMHLGELPIPDTQPDLPGKTVAGHTRRASRTDFARARTTRHCSSTRRASRSRRSRSPTPRPRASPPTSSR